MPKGRGIRGQDSMKHLYLVRHGESTQNVGINEQLRIPDHAIPLTDLGHEQASKAGEFLSKRLSSESIDNIAMWVSPYRRTRETAAEIRNHLHVTDVKEDDMLTELQFGIFDSLPKERVKVEFPVEWERFQNNRRFNGKFYARRPGGESPFDCEIRQKLFIDTLFRDFAQGGPDHIVIVGHGAALNIFRKAMFHYSHEWYEAEPNPGNCSIMHLILDNGKNTDAGYIYGEPAE